MRIGEMAELTGLSISNIRFYEKKGLIVPEREESSQYRNYTNQDVARLKQIILYRKMNISLEQIEEILSGKVTLQEVLTSQIDELFKMQQELQGALELCQKVAGDSVDEITDLDYYLNYVKEEEAQGKRFAKMEELMEDVSEFTTMSRFQPGIFLFLMRYPKAYKVTIFLLSVLCFAAPIIGIIDTCMDERFSMPKMIFWIVWLLTLIGSFLAFRKQKRK